MANINGNNRPNTLVGTRNDDDINGRGGNDTITARDGDDFVRGGPGGDRISGQRGDDTLLGEGGADNINGGQDDDGIDGGLGDDFVQGGPGINALTGGPGRDTFFINPDSEFDTVIDFNSGRDVISINGFSQIKNFKDLDIQTNRFNSVIDLGEIENGTAGQQVLTVLDTTNLKAGDFAFSAGPVVVALKVAAPQPGTDGQPGGQPGGQAGDQPPPAGQPDDGGGRQSGEGAGGVMGVSASASDDGWLFA
jgi:Ca2+-binding RTX toxin-like protein